MSFVRKASTVFMTRVLMFLIAMVSSIAVARIVGPEGKGIFSLAVLASTVLCYSTNLGVGTGSGYFLGRKKIPLEHLAGNWLSLSVLIGLTVTAVALLLVTRASPAVFPTVPPVYVSIAVLSVPFMIMKDNLQSLFKAGDDFRRFNITDLIQPSVFLLSFLILTAMNRERGVAAAVISLPVSYAVSAIAAAILMNEITRLRFRWSAPVVRDAVNFGLKGYLARFVEFLNLRFDMLIVNLLMAPRFVGYYSIAVVIAEKILYIPTVFSLVLYPRVAHGAETSANIDTSKVCRQAVLIIILVCGLVLAVGRFAVETLYSTAFSPAVAPLFVLIPGIVAAGISRVIANDLMARGHPGIILWSGLAAFIVNVTLNLIFIPKLGISGAALATDISYTVNAIALVAGFLKISGLSAREALVPGVKDLKIFARGIKAIATGEIWRG